MKEDFEIDTNGSDDVSVLALFARREYEDGDITDEKYLQWEYFENPFGNALITLARDRSHSIASQYVLLPVQYVISGKIITGSLSLNTLTGAGYRGQGLFRQTAEQTYSRSAALGISFTIGIPNKNSFLVFISKLNFAHAGNLSFMIKPLRPAEILKSLLNRKKKKRGEEIPLDIGKFPLRDRAICIFDPGKERELYLQFLSEWNRGNRISLHRTPEYLAWRYLKNPNRKYYLLRQMENGKMISFAVVRLLHVFGMRTCVLMEYSTLESSGGHELLHVIISGMKMHGLDCIISASANRKNEFIHLKKSGFRSVPEFLLPQQLPFIVRIHKQFENSEMLQSLENWHFTFGDYDIF